MLGLQELQKAWKAVKGGGGGSLHSAAALCSLVHWWVIGWVLQSQKAEGPIRSKDFTPGQGFDSIVVEMASFTVFYLQWLKASHPRAPTEVIGAPQHPSLGRLFRCFQCVDCFAQCSFLETYHNLPHLNSINAFRFVFLDVSGISSLPGAALSTIEPTSASDRTL